MRLVAAAVLGITAACSNRPSDEDLDAWRHEAVAANVAAIGAAQRSATAEPGRSLTIVGQVRTPLTLGWDELDKLATTHVKTVSPQDPAHAGKVTDFRGVLVRDAIDRAGALPGADELTFVSIDAFRAPVAIADVRRFRTLLAIEADGAPIKPADGGPIFLVHPHSESPETVALYPDRYWSFYVTHVIVGTEPARLAVTDHVLDAAALDALPQVTWTGVVKYKSYWPSDPVKLRGVRLRDALRAANVGVPAGGGVVVRGKPAIERDPKDPRRISAADLDRCDFLLATHWSAPDGSGEQPIAARLGGPLTLAVTDACAQQYDDHFWMTFVEELVPER